jgi:DNA-binding transcriptional MerR regulator
MEKLNIGEVARRVGIRQSAIRYYESMDLLSPPARTSGWRSFEPEVVDRLQVIRAAREMGFSLDEIRLLLDGFSPDTPPPAMARPGSREARSGRCRDPARNRAEANVVCRYELPMRPDRRVLCRRLFRGNPSGRSPPAHHRVTT